LFVAVFPPEEARADLRRHLTAGPRAAGQAARPVRLTPVERWHVTLAFLGEVDAARLPEIERAIAAVPPRASIALRIAGGGSFGGQDGSDVRGLPGERDGSGGQGRIGGRRRSGGRGRAGVLWAGLAGEVSALAAVHADLRAALVAAGLPHDPRPFTPHLTVAYAQSPDVRAALDEYHGPAWTVDGLVLVHSRHAEGGGYHHLGVWPLV
jgi:2'-5' RNA ligase